jgi:hypothetical protein
MDNPIMRKISVCRVCGSAELKPFFDLGDQALANSLPATQEEIAAEAKYPLSLTWCAECNLVQLEFTVDPKILFSSYVWVTGTSEVAQNFADQFYREITSRTTDPKTGYALEIASNDGTFLKPFLKNGHTVLGVDPAENIVKMAVDAGVPTKRDFWSRQAADAVVAEHGQAKMIFARNVLPHVANTRDFVEGLAAALADDGTLAIEAHHAQIILEGLHYDSIYHEHLCYFTFKSLERLLSDFGLFVFDIAESPISGGSMIVYAKKIKEDQRPAVAAYRANEASVGANALENWQSFAARSIAHRQKLLNILEGYRKNGEPVYGWGASARSSTMLNFCGIDTGLIQKIVDLNPLKHNRFTAGTHIPILAAEEVMKDSPKHICVLAWNFTDEIKGILKEKFNYTGDYIVPLPGDPRVDTN